MSNVNVEVIIGPPGTGKTTTIAAMVREHVEARSVFGSAGRSPAVVVSLTRAAAAEAADERRGVPLPRSAIGTLHSMAYRALGNPELVVGHIDDWNREHADAVIGSAGGDVDDPAWDRTPSSAGDHAVAQYDLMRARMVPRESWPPWLQSFAAEWESWKRERGLLDFTDLIERAKEDTSHAPGEPSAMFIDEAQDMSLLELSLLRHWIIAGGVGRLVIVGDPDQAIYTFRGAAPEMFARAGTVSVLDRSHRVPRAVHAVASRWVRQIPGRVDADYEPRNADGFTGRIACRWADPGETLVQWVDEHTRDGQTCMIVAPCSYMLDPAIALLRRAGVPFANPWRRKRADWNPLAPRSGSSMADRIVALCAALGGGLWTWRQLHQWTDAIASDGVLVRGAKAVINAAARDERVRDTFAGVVELAGLFEQDAMSEILAFRDDVQAIRWWSERLLPSKARQAAFPMSVALTRGVSSLRDAPRCHVGTVHSFKGAQADHVLVFPDISRAGNMEWMRDRSSIIRMFYVALTRARESVWIAEPSGPAVPLVDFLRR